MAAILEIYFALLLLNRKANLSGNQVNDTGPSWPSCFIMKMYVVCTHLNRHIEAILMSITNVPLFLIGRSKRHPRLSLMSRTNFHGPKDVRATYTCIVYSNIAIFRKLPLTPIFMLLPV